MKKKIIAASVLFTMALTGCGGGSGDSGSKPTPINEAPVVESIAHNGGQKVYQNQEITLSVVATDDHAVTEYHLYIDDKYAQSFKQPSIKVTTPNADSVTYKIVALDEERLNDSASMTIQLLAPNEAPVITSFEHDGGHYIYKGDKLTFTGTAEDDKGITGAGLYRDGERVGDMGNGAFTITVHEEHEWMYKVRDEEGLYAQETMRLKLSETGELEDMPIFYDECKYLEVYEEEGQPPVLREIVKVETTNGYQVGYYDREGITFTLHNPCGYAVAREINGEIRKETYLKDMPALVKQDGNNLWTMAYFNKDTDQLVHGGIFNPAYDTEYRFVELESQPNFFGYNLKTRIWEAVFADAFHDQYKGRNTSPTDINFLMDESEHYQLVFMDTLGTQIQGWLLGSFRNDPFTDYRKQKTIWADGLNMPSKCEYWEYDQFENFVAKHVFTECTNEVEAENDAKYLAR